MYVVSRKLDSPVIQVRDLSILVAHPDQQGRRICHQVKALFALTQDSVRLPLSCSLPEQCNNPKTLSSDHYNGRNDVLAVALPETRLPVQDQAAWRQS